MYPNFAPMMSKALFTNIWFKSLKELGLQAMPIIWLTFE